MEVLIALSVGAMTGSGVFLMLRRRSFPVVLGLSLIGYAVNLFLFASGRLTIDSAPLLGRDLAAYPDALPQALVLTAIVIGFAMTAFFIVLALRALGDVGNDDVDGRDAPPLAGPGPAPDHGGGRGGAP